MSAMAERPDECATGGVVRMNRVTPASGFHQCLTYIRRRGRARRQRKANRKSWAHKEAINFVNPYTDVQDMEWSSYQENDQETLMEIEHDTENDEMDELCDLFSKLSIN